MLNLGEVSPAGSKAIDIALIVPAYNEGDDRPMEFQSNLQNSLSFLSQEYVGNHISALVVDDGSETDKTAKIAVETGWQVISHDKNTGKGAAIRTGVDTLKTADIFAVFDADNSYPPEAIASLIDAVRSGYDIAVAKRHASQHANSLRSLGHKAIATYLAIVTPTGLSDPQAGALAFEQGVTNLWLSSKTNRYFTPTEVFHRAYREGKKAFEQEVPMTPRDNSRVRPFVDGFRIMIDALGLRLSG